VSQEKSRHSVALASPLLRPFDALLTEPQNQRRIIKKFKKYGLLPSSIILLPSSLSHQPSAGTVP
jgi:hypothetical protein